MSRDRLYCVFSVWGLTESCPPPKNIGIVLLLSCRSFIGTLWLDEVIGVENDQFAV